ncbi:MAG: Arm DNA-binding domain-containing protein [Castellaniella sp.]
MIEIGNFQTAWASSCWVKPTSGKLWPWKYRLQGKENLFAIGGFPQVSLAEARAAREKARALVSHANSSQPV